MEEMESLTLRCACGSAEHSLHYCYDPEENEIHTEIFLRQYRNIFQRIWIAIKYIFGYKCRYGHFDCFEMTPEAAKDLRILLDKYLDK